MLTTLLYTSKICVGCRFNPAVVGKNRASCRDLVPVSVWTVPVSVSRGPNAVEIAAGGVPSVGDNA